MKLPHALALAVMILMAIVVSLVQSRRANSNVAESLQRPVDHSKPTRGFVLPLEFRRTANLTNLLIEPGVTRWMEESRRDGADAGFAQWVEEYLKGMNRGAALAEQGIGAVRQRREQLAGLIQTDPERALELAVPAELAAVLPPNIRELLEERVSGRGRLAVLGAIPEPGKEKEVAPTFRVATINGRDYDAFPYGRRLGEPSRENIPLHGIALENFRGRNLLAVHENPARRLSSFELKQLKRAAQEPLCAVSGASAKINNAETALDAGGEIIFTCGTTHEAMLQNQLIAAESGDGVASSSDGPVASAYTEGHKRILFIRVDFPDLSGAPFSDFAGLQLITNMNNYWTEASYGRTSVALPGEGSELTPTFRMTNNSAFYGTNSFYDRLRTEARAAADAAGYNRANYDFHVVCLGFVVGFNWSGLAYVGAGGTGGPGAWIRGTSASLGTTAHELGHNLGLNHANFWDTAGQSTIGAGTSVEYGDNYDTMGGGGSARLYNARYRAYLNWLTASEVATFTTNGVYRIMAYDMTNSFGVRALRIVRNGAGSTNNNYWMEFRQKSGSTRWQTSGIELRWSGNGNQSTLLLDTTPGSPDGKSDAAIVLGRTFSDRALNIHITPLALAGTSPESIDVMVVRGTSPTNVAPVVSIEAATTNASVNTTVTFTATATDTNGDPLAYFWDFGDGTFGTNGAAANKSWSLDGEYVVRCTVSDMRAGQASDSVVVRVGAPSTFQISGRVLNNGLPVEGTRVSAASTRVTYSDSDGSYTLVGLPAGSYNVSAVLEGYSFTHPAFVNPVNVGPNAVNVDFVAGSSGGQMIIPVVATGSEWKYLDDGSNQGTDWITPSFNDVTWESGRAELGYGDDDEATVVGFGPDSNAKYITTYFRRAFVVDDPTQFASLTLGVLRDDGAVVYLNGREVFRSNMPGGAINYTTLASANVTGGNESAFYETDVNPSFLAAGTNVFAVEIHQNSGTSADISFDLYLNGLSITNLPRGAFLTSPTLGAAFVGPTNILLTANASAGFGGTVTNVEFFANETRLGAATARPYVLTWSNALLGIYKLTARATDNTGTVLTSAPVAVTVSALLFARGSAWRYLDDGSDQGTNWTLPEFDDRGWSNGLARLGYGGDGEVTTVGFGSDANSKYITTYFRRPFVAPPGMNLTNLLFRYIRDDGIVVYVNGVEMFRNNMPAGSIRASTVAASNITGTGETTFFETTVGLVAPLSGTNIVAAEIHQSTGTSADLGFDLELLGNGFTAALRPALALIRNGTALEISWPESAEGYTLYESRSLDSGAEWIPVNASTMTRAGRKIVTVIASGTNRFYRLHNP